MKFSERMGFVKKRIQKDNLDKELRTQLWNVIVIYLNEYPLLKRAQLLKIIWCDELVRPYDDFPQEPPEPDKISFLVTKTDIRRYGSPLHYYNQKIIPAFENKVKRIQTEIQEYFLNCKWYLVYDFLEFYVNKILFNQEHLQLVFTGVTNDTLEDGMSAFRFVGTEIAPILDEIEIKEIEKALINPLTVVKEHINQALILLSDRQNPDYRNSIKESISAVESLCRKISNKPNATLGDALKIIEKSEEIILHKAQKDAFSKLYGWTSDKESGIRHGMLDVPNLKQEDARFMLIACSAFINYLTEKTLKTGIELK